MADVSPRGLPRPTLRHMATPLSLSHSRGPLSAFVTTPGHAPCSCRA